MNPRALFLCVMTLVCGIASARVAVVDNPPLFLTDEPVYALRTGDFDGDAKLDFAVMGWEWYAGGRLCVFAGNGDATFDAPVCTNLTAPQNSRDLLSFEIGRVDDDAILDVVVVRDGSPQDVIQVYHGNGNGSFAAIGASISSSMCGLADATGDARPDIIACNLAVLPNIGAGGFGAPTGATLSSGYGRMSVLDVNGDGKQDVVGESWAQNIHYGNGNGTFQNAVQVEDTGRVAIGDFDASGHADFAFFGETLALRRAPGWTRTTHGRAGWSDAAVTPDLNGDGRADLVSAGRGTVSTWIMDANGVPGPRTLYTTPSSAAMLAAGDFDADGSTDVLVAGTGDAFSKAGVVALLRGSPTGALAATRAWDAGGAPNGVAVSEVTGDAIPDLVTVTSGILQSSVSVVVFAGLGDGTFAHAPEVTTVVAQDASVTPYFADFDGDGALDVLLAGGYTHLCFLANGDGTYRQASSITGQSSYGITRGVGDFNGDGDPDFVNLYNSVLHFYAGNGDGTFDESVAANYEISYEGFRIGDVNGDGRDDLVTGYHVLFGQTSGAFTKITYSPYFGAPPTALADLDGDGKLDLILDDGSLNDGATIEVRKGNGDGTFVPLRTITRSNRKPGTRSYGSSVGDFNGDGDADISFGASILLGDGEGGFEDQVRFRDPADDGSCSAADADGNGTDDLLCIASGAQAVTVVRTSRTESLDLPLSFVIETVPASVQAGVEFHVTVRSTTQTQLAPTGTVAFSIGGVVAGFTELVNGEGSTMIRAMSVGTHALTAHYGGDDVYATADAAPRQIEITRAPSWIDYLYSPGLDNVTTTSGLRVIGSVQSWIGNPTGTVTLYIDNVARGTQAAPDFDLAAGPLAEGTHSVRVEYSGDASSLPYTTHTRYFTVRKPEIEMNVTVDPPSGAAAGTPVTITVTFPGEPALTGTVQVSTFGVSFGADIVNGVATLTTSELPPTWFLNVSYGGNATYRATAKSISYTITDAPVAPGPTSLYLIPPCRVLDTRDTHPYAISWNEERSLTMARRCGIPAGAKAVAVNIVAINPTSSGYVTAFPAASPRPSTSTINYRTGKTRANNAVIPLSAGGLLKLFNSGPHPVHVVVDVTGYFR